LHILYSPNRVLVGLQQEKDPFRKQKSLKCAAAEDYVAITLKPALQSQSSISTQSESQSQLFENECNEAPAVESSKQIQAKKTDIENGSAIVARNYSYSMLKTLLKRDVYSPYLRNYLA
jgi:hypothetical protein